MANDLRTSTIITDESVMILKELTPFTSMLPKPLEDRFGKPGLKPGESYDIRKPARFIGGDGDAITTENMVDDRATITLEPLVNVAFEFSDREFTLELDEFSDRYIRPAMTTIASKIEARAMEYATKATFNTVGVPGTVPNSDLTYLNAGDLLTEHGAPLTDRCMIVDTRKMSTLVNADRALFHSGQEISKQYLDAAVGRAHNFDWYTTTSHWTQTIGTYASSTPLVNGASQSGSSLITDGWNSGASDLNEGDTFTIANVNAVHPQNRQSTGQLQEFVVTADISDTAGAMTISISPEIKGPGDPHQNVDALPADDAAILLDGAGSGDPVAYSGNTTAMGLGFHPSAFMAAFVPLERPKQTEVTQVSRDPDTGISVRFTRQWEIRTSKYVNRFDVLWGFLAVYPELAVKVYG